MSLPPLVDTDEARHLPGQSTWYEIFSLDAIAQSGTLAVQLGLAFLPSRVLCWVCCVGPGRQLLTIVETEVDPPRALEVRGPGLWVDLQCLVPFDHVMLGIEAFAVGLDDPADALGRLWGDRVPFGVDLEWDTAGPITTPVESAASAGAVTGYELACSVHGEVLVADERIDFEGFGSRRHLWGPVAPWAAPWARSVDVTGVQPRSSAPRSPDGGIEVLAEAPLQLASGAVPGLAGFRLDRALAVEHDGGDPQAPGRAVWLERSAPC